MDDEDIDEAIPISSSTATVKKEKVQRKRGKKQENNYCLEGMSLGMCFGLLVGIMLGNYIGVAVSIGMIVGLVLGMLIPRKAESGDK